MSAKSVSTSTTGQEQEITDLLETLRVTGKRLEELTFCQVDTVTDRDGRILMLQGTREQLEQSELSKQTAILNALPVNIALLSPDGIILSVNDSWRIFSPPDAMQWGPGQAIGRNYVGICENAVGLGADEAHKAAGGIRSVLAGSETDFSMDYDCGSPAEQLWLRLSVTPLSRSRRKGVVVMYENITASKRDQSKLVLLSERLALATAVARVGVWEWDVASGTLMWDATMFTIYGFPQMEMVSYERWSAAVHPKDLCGVETILKTVIETRTEKTLEFRIVRADGNVKYISAAARAVVNEFGSVQRVIGVNVDITERKSAEQKSHKNEVAMTHLAQHDSLTGLPSQIVLRDRIDQAIKAALRNGTKIAVLFLDLNGFKHINDSLGHAVGDKLLQSTAKRLKESIRAFDTVSRFGGDEFVVLLPEVKHPEGTATAATRILKGFSSLHSAGEHEINIGVSIGISVYPEDGLDNDTLIKNADTAMYQAKAKGGPNYQFFHPDMNVRAVERQFIEQNLRCALERDELTLHYQPKVNLKNRAIVGVEALLRWNHHARGLISPAEFIPVAEDCGLMVPIGMWVLEQACRQGRAWMDAGFPAINMAVNVSGRQFQSDLFENRVMEILARTGIDPKYLELEVTESLLIKSPDFTASLLQNLREKGVKIAIDDFGTGYSSLSYLQRFPIDTLKVDQSFIRQLNTPDGDNIVKAIIQMGQNLGMQIVAEGVETEIEATILASMGCEAVQGYLFSRAVSAADVIVLRQKEFQSGCAFKSFD